MCCIGECKAVITSRLAIEYSNTALAAKVIDARTCAKLCALEYRAFAERTLHKPGALSSRSVVGRYKKKMRLKKGFEHFSQN